jgi:cation transport protein ChaC
MNQPWEKDEAPQPPREIAECLARGSELWIFGYGSLMWDPGFAHGEARPALLRGYHRRFCVYSRRYRGTPERPGLVLGLDRGGSCRGVAFRVAACDVPTALRYLWERELTNRTYRLSELPVETASGPLRARALVVDRRHPSYTGRLPLDEVARHILDGVGTRGPCREYLEKTVAALHRLGVTDGPLHRLEEKVRALAAGEQPMLALDAGFRRGDG